MEISFILEDVCEDLGINPEDISDKKWEMLELELQGELDGLNDFVRDELKEIANQLLSNVIKSWEEK